MASFLETVPGAETPEPARRYAADPRSDILRGLFDYWREKCGGTGIPARRDIDPVEMGRVLPHILLIDVETDPERYRVRLVGTHVVRYLGRDHTGRYYDEVYSPEVYEKFVQGVRMAAQDRLPVSSHGRVYFAPDYEHMIYESLTLPLSSDGDNVDMLLMGLHVGVPPFERS